ncbi:MAG: insulinase family protein [Planctomycetes bacterium]|nr:insulinase family protein [Planctomycetota bacterium]
MEAERCGVFARTALPGGIDLLVWRTPKFKTTTIRVGLLETLDAQASARAIIAALLKRGCRSHPDMMSLARRLEELYGAGLSVDVGKRGERQDTHVRLTVVNDRFLGPAAGAFGGGLALLKDVLADPVTEDGGFRAAEFEQERVNLVRAIRGLLDDKIAYAHQRLVEEMFRGEPYARFELGDVESAGRLERHQVFAFHRERLRGAPLEAFAVGGLDEAQVARLGEALGALCSRDEAAPAAPESSAARAETRTVVEEHPVAQSKLLIGYRVDTRRLGDREYFALGLFNAILGAGGSQAKLFKEVREKRGLAYYAHSSLDRLKGFLLLSAGVAAARWEEAAAVMREQVLAMRQGRFSEEEMEVARAALLNSLDSVNDSPGQAIDFASVARAAGRPPCVQTVAGLVRSLAREDVVQAAALPVEGVCYVLKGTDEHGTGAP